jgi:hypothetical protein
MKGIKNDVKERIGNFTVREYRNAYAEAKQKYEQIKKRERKDHGTWYLTVLISEMIIQHRFTRFCINLCAEIQRTEKSRTHVGQRV